MFIDILIVCVFIFFSVVVIQSKLYFLTKSVLILSVFPFSILTLNQLQFIFKPYIDYGNLPNFIYLQAYSVFFIFSLTIGLFFAVTFSSINLAFIRSDMPVFLSFRKFRYWERIILLFFLVGFFVNLSHVNFSISQLFLSPRAYELSFGSNTLTNYMYFLGPLAICNVIYRRYIHEKKKKFDIAIIIFCVIASVFHGIKFTIFDSLLIPTFFFALLEPKKSTRCFLFVVGFTAILFVLYGSFVRGGADMLVSYYVPNFLNAAHILDGVDYPYTGLRAILPGNAFSFLSLDNLNEGGFIFNPRYNMSTGLPTTIGFIFPVGTLALAFIYFYILLQVSKVKKSYLSSLLFSFLHIQALMFFFYPSFSKDKYWFLIFVPCLYISFFYIIGCVCTKKRYYLFSG